MIKNTSGLAVQPCRLHERFYYHARLLYYILRQKARGFFARGCSPLATPICEGAGAPSALPNVGAQLPRPQRAGAPPRAPGDFLMRRKSPKTHQEPPGSWTSGTRGRTPLDSPAPCPSGIGCEQKGSRHPRGLPLPSHGLKTQSVPSMKPEEKNKTDLPTQLKVANRSFVVAESSPARDGAQRSEREKGGGHAPGDSKGRSPWRAFGDFPRVGKVTRVQGGAPAYRGQQGPLAPQKSWGERGLPLYFSSRLR